MKITREQLGDEVLNHKNNPEQKRENQSAKKEQV